jgi:hypothetical protein
VTAPPSAHGGLPDLRAIRSHWKRLEAGDGAPCLRVAVLASYTADPLLPYLGTALSDAGLGPTFQTGPYNQVVQECLDPQSGTAAFDPDVVVVAQRLEELPRAQWESGLMQAAEAAVEASERLQAALIVVLPGIPDALPDGVGGDSLATGWFASATAARERLRSALAGRPNVYLADLETVVRTVGAGRAHHPGLFAHAKIPYRDEVFYLLGGRIARLIRLRFGDSCHAAAVVLDGLADADRAEGLCPLLGWLRAAQVRAFVLGSEDSAGSWRELTTASPALAGLADDWAFDSRQVEAHATELARVNGLEQENLAIMRWQDGALTVTASGTRAEPRSPVSLGENPEQWPARLAAAGIFDRLPTPGPEGGAPVQASGERQPSGLSLAEFVAGLRVEADFRAAADSDTDKIGDMLFRTKDFTLGTPFSVEDTQAALADQDRKLLLGSVRDRFGDLGTSVMIAVRRSGQDCLAEAFLISCPAMGKGVEDIAMRQITAAACELGTTRIVLQYQSTGRNEAAIDFLRSLPKVDPSEGLAIVVSAEPADHASPALDREGV